MTKPKPTLREILDEFQSHYDYRYDMRLTPKLDRDITHQAIRKPIDEAIEALEGAKRYVESMPLEGTLVMCEKIDKALTKLRRFRGDKQ
jgi:hypothetical protein